LKGLFFVVIMVPGAGIEPAQPQGPRDFKSLASTSSATQASLIMGEIYMLSGKWCQGIHFSKIHFPACWDLNGHIRMNYSAPQAYSIAIF
jgi:hypothetical protein